MNIFIDEVKENELKELSKIYVSLYDNIDIGERWTEESAYDLLKYWYNTHKDLFLVAHIDGQPVGAVMSGIKPWWDGMHLIDTEIFVVKEYQKLGIAKMLYKKHFEIALEKYGAIEMEAHTYRDNSGFPYSWYERMGFEEDKELIIIRGNIKKVLNKITTLK